MLRKMTIQCGTNFDSCLVGIAWMKCALHVHLLCVYVLINW